MRSRKKEREKGREIKGDKYLFSVHMLKYDNHYNFRE